MLRQLREGDVVVVWKLDRLSRSLKDLLHIMERIEAAGAGFRSLTEAIDTTTAAGRMMMQMVGAFAEFERAMIRERTGAGLAQARAEGRIGGGGASFPTSSAPRSPKACSRAAARRPRWPVFSASRNPPSAGSWRSAGARAEARRPDAPARAQAVSGQAASLSEITLTGRGQTIPKAGSFQRKAPLGPRRVGLGDLVDDVRVVLQRLEAVREAAGT
jgi:hypothetical protein